MISNSTLDLPAGEYDTGIYPDFFLGDRHDQS
jgi:hypothetical protein